MVDEIMDKRYDTETQAHQYLVKWEGFNNTYNTWEPESSLLEDVPEMVVDYNDKIEESVGVKDILEFLESASRCDIKNQPVPYYKQKTSRS
jgi:hypothetical protein